MTDAPEFKHDLFIVYAEPDSPWVKGYLLPALNLPLSRDHQGLLRARRQ